LGKEREGLAVVLAEPSLLRRESLISINIFRERFKGEPFHP
jgi:hypothetical protein